MTALPRVAPAAQGDASGAAFRAFLRIAELWQLTVEDQLVLLGRPARSTYFKWKKEGAAALPHDTLERLSYLLGSYKALQVLLPDPVAADGWVRRANRDPLFGGRSALERMLSGQVADLYVVRQYLDAQLGGWPG
jgi:hypothetical protein